MNIFKQWLKQLLEGFDNARMQRRLDKLWDIYQEEEFFCTMLPVVDKPSQGKSAAELTAKLWVDIIASGTVDRVINDNSTPYEVTQPIKVVVRRKNWYKFLAVADRYTTKSRHL